MQPNKNTYSSSDYKEIMQRALEIAKNNGYKFHNAMDYESFSITSYNNETGNVAIILRSENVRSIIYDRIQLLFYDINFAKAFFGQTWEHHLVEMSKSNSINEYISEYIKNYSNEKNSNK